jgi:hypothetical protein
LVDSFEYMMMYGLANPKNGKQAFFGGGERDSGSLLPRGIEIFRPVYFYPPYFRRASQLLHFDVRRRIST